MKKIILSMIATTLFMSSCSEKTITEYAPTYSSLKVQSGSLVSGEYSIGEVFSQNSIKISSELGGKITQLHKKIAENVSVGDPLFEIDMSLAINNLMNQDEIIKTLEKLKQTQISMIDTQISIQNEKLRSLMSNENILQNSQAGTKQAQNDTQNIYDAQGQNIQKNILMQETQIQNLKTSQENTNNLFLQKENELKNQSNAIISQSDLFFENSFSQMDNIFGITQQNKHKNDAYEIYLGAKISGLFSHYEKLYTNTFEQYQNIKKETDIKTKLTLYKNFSSNEFKLLSQSSTEVLKNSVSGVNFGENQIQSFLENTRSIENQNQNLILGISGGSQTGLLAILDTYDALEKEKKQSGDQISGQIEVIYKNIELLKSQKNEIEKQLSAKQNEISTNLKNSQEQNNIQISQKEEILLAQKNLEKQKENIEHEFQSKIAEVKLGKNISQDLMKKSKVFSPMTGLITKKMKNTYDNVLPGEIIYELQDPKTLKIIFEVPKNFPVGVGDIVTIGGENFKNQEAKIHTEQPETKNQNKILEAWINNENQELKIGEKVQVYYGKKISGITIPNSSIIKNYLTPGVYVRENNTIKYKNIEILHQNENFSQIQGLVGGEEIITAGMQNLYDGQILSPNP